MTDKEPHGNSKDSQKPQHIYKIHDTAIEVNDTVEIGISGQPLNNDGTSPRANEQVNKENKKTGWQRFVAIILFRNVENREQALQIEEDLVRKYKQEHDGQMPPRQKRPNPKT